MAPPSSRAGGGMKADRKMRAVILAAGRGTRLNGSDSGDPKCLLRIGATTLIERQIRQLRAAGIEDIAVVVGCRSDRVRHILGGSVQFVENARFAQTNSLYSLWLARPLLLDGFVVLNCDVLFHARILWDLVTARCEDGAVVAYRGDDETMGAEEMKVRVRRGCVVDFSKEMRPADADGENVGLLKFGRSGARRLVEHLDRLVANGHTRDWAPRAFSAFAEERALHAIATRGYPWIEIDFPADYERAKAEVLPEIERLSPPAASDDRPYDATPFEPAPVLVDA